MHAEGAAAGVGAADRTGAAPLRSDATQSRGQAELVEHALHRQLPPQVREVDVGSLA